jgi:hypothetical protein
MLPLRVQAVALRHAGARGLDLGDIAGASDRELALQQFLQFGDAPVGGVVSW